jgi:branched-chain amino acid transport system ATP-binding protein
MSSEESNHLIDLLRALHAQFGCGLLIVEHNMHLVMGLCHRIQVLDYGKTISQGPPQQIKTDPVVIEAYLGRNHAQDNARS